jgi:malate dehydrogenase
MAGTLDSSRFRNSLATAAAVSPADVSAVTLGSHGAEMVPVVSSATVRGRPVRDVLSTEIIARCVRETIDGGASVVALRRTGSASIAPAHAIVELLDALRGALVEPVPVSAHVDGAYGIDGVFLGVPARLGRAGVREVVEVRLDADERAALHAAAAAIRSRLC